VLGSPATLLLAGDFFEPESEIVRDAELNPSTGDVTEARILDLRRDECFYFSRKISESQGTRRSEATKCEEMNLHFRLMGKK